MDIFVLCLIILFLWNVKFYKKSYHIEYLSIQSSVALKGLFAVIIMYHHLSQYTKGGFLFHKFSLIGYLVSAFFFFLSGYGLQRKYIINETYNNKFLSHRFLKLLIPYFIMNFIYWWIYALAGISYSISDIMNMLLQGEPLVKNSWYILCILFFYLAFYCLMEICNGNYIHMILGAGIYNFIWIFFCRNFHYDVWWYNSSHLLIIGMIWAVFEEKITKLIQKYYILFVTIFVTAFLFLEYKCNHTKIISDTLLEMLLAFCFVVLVNLIIMKFHIGNVILNYIGTISLELYMIHGLFIVELQQYIFNEFLFCSIVFICSIMSAYILHKIFTILLKCL